MIISQSQLDISNKSYTNKDFADVYTELLTYAEKLSYRFSPVSANETDPFIIMLKLAAFVCDKVNYNVDKNILERFISSCTQETSMRELTSMLGYYMHYYKSATTDVVFKSNIIENSIVVPKFSVLTNQNDIQFITLTDATIDISTKKSLAVKAIQGKLKTLSILGNNIIQLENLDINNRIYFPEAAVAENGVLITSDVEVDDWIRVDNLNEQEYLSPVFYFGYDSSVRLPYVEFPTWISKIIGSGLNIKYIISDGYNGNIAAGSFISLSRSSKDDDIEDSEIQVINVSATDNGDDPETIEESYSGFKRLVGTLDTLVTCRDYAAKIYDLTNSYGNNLVSNVVVSDRRTDLNYSTQLYTVDDFGKTYKNVIANSSDGSPELTPHDLCIYPYKPLRSYNLLAIPESNIGGYDDAYKFQGIFGTSDFKAIEDGIEGSKAISHQYKTLKHDDIVAIYIYLKLNAVITTTNKISNIEAQQLLQKINQNLLIAYNSRTISIGNEIPFDEIHDTILNSDARIKTVSLQEPLQYPAISVLGEDNLPITYRSDSNEDDELAAFNEKFNFIALKNIASGRVALFDYDSRFQYNYWNTDNNLEEKVSKISTYANIKMPKAGGSSSSNYTYEYTLGENEAIQLIAPKFNSFVKYPYGVVYNLHLNDNYRITSFDDNANQPKPTTYRYIPKGTDYRLQEGEYCLFAYADSQGEWNIDAYIGSNNSDPDNLIIINPNFDMLTTAQREIEETADKLLLNDYVNQKVNLPNNVIISPSIKDQNSISFYMLSSNDEVQCKKPTTDHLDKVTYCYWITNNSNRIDWNQCGEANLGSNSKKYEYEYILREGEYFYYTDAASTALIEYGSGTKLVLLQDVLLQDSRTDETILRDLRAQWIIPEENLINLNDITDDGLNALAEYFIIKRFTSEYPLDIYINDIKTLTEGDTISISYRSTNPGFSEDADGMSWYDIGNNTFESLQTATVIKTYQSYVTDEQGNIIYEGEDGSQTVDNDDADITLTPKTATKQLEIKIYPEIYYTYDGDDLEGDTSAESTSKSLLPDRSSLPSRYQWQIRGLLDIDCGSEKAQYLGKTHEIHLYGVNGERIYSGSDSDLTSFKSNIDITMNGGIDLNLKYLDVNTLDYTYPTFLINGIDSITRNFLKSYDGNFYFINTPTSAAGNTYAYFKSITEENNEYIKFYLPPVSKNQYVGFSIYVPHLDVGSEIMLEVESGQNIYISKLYEFNQTSSKLASLSLHTGLNNIIIYSESDDGVDANYLYFKIKAKKVSDSTIQLGDIKSIVGINRRLGLSYNTMSEAIESLFYKNNDDEIYKRIPNIDNAYIFSDLDPVKQIEVSDDYSLRSAQGFYDPNNVANAWVMPRIDFKNSQIKIANNSLK